MRFDPRKIQARAVWQSLIKLKSQVSSVTTLNSLAYSTSLISIYSLIWIWFLGATYKADFPYSFGDYLKAPILEFFGMIFYTLITVFFMYWLMPMVFLIGMPVFFLVSLAAGWFSAVFFWEYLKHDDKLDLILLVAPVALGLFAYWGIPRGFTTMVETYKEAFAAIPDLVDWAIQHILVISVLYLGPVVWMIIRARGKEAK